MKNHAVFLFVLLGLSVLLGSFGSHFIKVVTEDQKLTSIWANAVEYQFYHALGGILMLLVFKQCNIMEKWPVNFLIAGIFLFCGFFYLKTGLKLTDPTIKFRYLRYLRPIGGLCWVTGWFGAAALINRKIVHESKRDGGKKSRRKRK